MLGVPPFAPVGVRFSPFSGCPIPADTQGQAGQALSLMDPWVSLFTVAEWDRMAFNGPFQLMVKAELWAHLGGEISKFMS